MKEIYEIYEEQYKEVSDEMDEIMDSSLETSEEYWINWINSERRSIIKNQIERYDKKLNSSELELERMLIFHLRDVNPLYRQRRKFMFKREKVAFIRTLNILKADNIL